MALTKLTADISYISKLGDDPAGEPGMTPALLKEKFDAGGNMIKDFINDTLLPELDAALAARLSVGALAEGIETALSEAKASGDFKAEAAEFQYAGGFIKWRHEGETEWRNLLDISDLKGDKGDKGDAATISIGTVTTGAADTPASVTNSGTSSDAVLNFVIPRGVAGENYVTTSTATDISGILKGNGSTVSAAVANTDYAAAVHKSRHASGGADALTPGDIGAVPATRTINGYDLSANRCLSASDVGALPISGGTLTGTQLKFNNDTYDFICGDIDVMEMVGTPYALRIVRSASSIFDGVILRNTSSGQTYRLFGEHNTIVTASDPGAGSSLAAGNLLFVYEN